MTCRGTLTAIALVIACALPAQAATFNVDSSEDAPDASADGLCLTGTGTCTLRAAIQEANRADPQDTINLPAGTYTLTLTGQFEDEAATGDLDITKPAVIVGAGAATTIVDGNASDRIFDLFVGAPATISGLTIRNGNPGASASGGGVFTSDTLTMDNVVISGNTADSSGGGIYNEGTLVLTDVTLSGNMGGGRGGALDNGFGTATLRKCTLSGNSAITGGGIASDSELTLENTTLSGNVASSTGGAFRNNASATLRHVTMSGHMASIGGGASVNNIGDIDFAYTIVANSLSGSHCADFGTLTSSGHNVDSGNSCGFNGTGDRTGTDPLLGPLQANGGPTLTHALSAGSPAIDIGGTDCPPPATDQRGVARPADGNSNGLPACDGGAFELEPGGTSTTTTLSACPTGPTFESIDCRLLNLTTTLRALVQAGPLRDKLDASLTKANTQLDLAQQELGSSPLKRVKSLLGKTRKSLGKFRRRLNSRKAKRELASDLRAALAAAADELRQDVAALRSSLSG